MSDLTPEQVIVNEVWSEISEKAAVMGGLRMAALIVEELRRIAEALEEQTWGGDRR